MRIDNYEERARWAQEAFDLVREFHPGAPGFNLHQFPKQRIESAIRIVDFLLYNGRKKAENDEG